MAYVIDDLPAAGTPMLYRKAAGKVFHLAIIDSGIIITQCGLRAQMRNRKPQLYGIPVSDPNKDELFYRPSIEAVLDRKTPICGRCW